MARHKNRKKHSSSSSMDENLAGKNKDKSVKVDNSSSSTEKKPVRENEDASKKKTSPRLNTEENLARKADNCEPENTKNSTRINEENDKKDSIDEEKCEKRDSTSIDDNLAADKKEDKNEEENLAEAIKRINKRLDTVDSLASDIKSIKEDIKGIRETDIKKIKDDIAGLMVGVDFAQDQAQEADAKAERNTLKINDLENQIAQIRSDLHKSQSENIKLKEHVIRIEAQDRRNNLIIDGIQETEGENCLQTVYKVMHEKLELENPKDIKIDRCHRLGNGKKPRPMIFKVHHFTDRERIWGARRKLKDTSLWLREDFPIEIVKRRQILDPVRKAAVSQGKRAFLTYDKLILDGTSYTVDSTHALPQNLKPEEVATKRGKGITAFFSRSSPLSNFSPCSFTDKDGKKFSSTEQYYQHAKATYNDDQTTANLIMKTDDPAECKRLGDTVQIVDTRKWKAKCLDIMYDGCLAKFKQNAKCGSFLKSTKNDVLVEASPKDSFWGVGLNISHKDIMTPTSWKGFNHLGKILKRVRDEIS